MGDPRVIMEDILPDGLVLRFSDMTRHYFGGYFHLVLEASVEYPLEPGWFSSGEEYDLALKKIGSTVRFSRTMERMAVPREEVDPALMQMLDAFRKHVTSYLAREDFRRGYARSLASREREKKSRPFIPA